MDYRWIAYTLIVGWAVSVWVGRRPRDYGPPDGWPDWWCPRCSIIIGALGGWVTVWLLGPTVARGFGEVTVVAAAGGIFFASAYNLVVGSFAKTSARVDPTRQ